MLGTRSCRAAAERASAARGLVATGLGCPGSRRQSLPLCLVTGAEPVFLFAAKIPPSSGKLPAGRGAGKGRGAGPEHGPGSGVWIRASSRDAVASKNVLLRFFPSEELSGFVFRLMPVAAGKKQTG